MVRSENGFKQSSLDRFVFGKIPVGKMAPTNLSCAKRLAFDVACGYLFVTWRLLCRK